MPTLKEAVSAGDIVRNHYPIRMNDHLNLYLGSGRCGACFDVWGLMHKGVRGWPGEDQPQSYTSLMHADHWHRGAFGLDFWLPVARLKWAGAEPPPPSGYRQTLRLYDAQLETELLWPGLRLSIRATFHPERRDLLAIGIRYQASAGGAMPDLRLTPEVDLTAHYDQHLKGASEVLAGAATMWQARVSVGTANSIAAVKLISSDGQAQIETARQGALIRFSGSCGSHLLLIGTAAMARRDELTRDLQAVCSSEQYFAEAASAWHQRWGEASISVPVREYQALWARSHYYVLCSYAPDVRSPAAPMGWAGNAWPFHFPQDVSYIHPALLRLGHFDIARAWVEFYRGYLNATRAVTRRVYKADGAMWAWEHPIGPDTRMLEEGSPNWFQYEIHNAAYPLRMAYETALYLRDDKWTREVAWPVVHESARFFGSVLREQGDGSWGIHVTPSMGQDEAGGKDAKNYLCALYSARYSLSVAMRLARALKIDLPEAARWERILADGLAFKRLYQESHGFCVACEGLLGVQMLGKQKHPVQLNPLMFLPLDKPDGHVVRAYERRYEICVRPGEKFFAGWTLAAYWLASAHMGDAAGLLKGLGDALPSRYVDPDYIQIYETSGSMHCSYYVTSHGLYLQALNDALVDSYWDGVKIGKACPESWREASFENLRVPDGRRISGHRYGTQWSVREER